MAVIELVAQKTVTDEADRARRVAASQQARRPAPAEEAPAPTRRRPRSTRSTEVGPDRRRRRRATSSPRRARRPRSRADRHAVRRGRGLGGRRASDRSRATPTRAYRHPARPRYDRTAAEAGSEADGLRGAPRSCDDSRADAPDDESVAVRPALDRGPPSPPGRRRLGRFRLDIAYDGTDFSGWAAQPGRRTVRGVLTEALSTVLREPVALTVAGRTDAGVHATGQVAHADLPADRRPRPGSCAGWPGCCRPTSGCARSRPCRPRSTPGSRRCAATTATGSPPRRAAPSRCAPATRWPGRTRWTSTPSTPRPRCLLGEHDFAAFCKRREGATTVRELQRLDWTREPRRRRRGRGVAPTRSATRWCAAWSARCWTSAAGGAAVDWPAALLAARSGPRRWPSRPPTASRSSASTTRRTTSWPPGPSVTRRLRVPGGA